MRPRVRWRPSRGCPMDVRLMSVSRIACRITRLWSSSQWRPDNEFETDRLT